MHKHIKWSGRIYTKVLNKFIYIHLALLIGKKHLTLYTDLSTLKCSNLRAGPHYFNAQHYSSFRQKENETFH